MGGKSSSSSATTTQTAYNTEDNRSYVEAGATGISNSSNINISSADAKIIGVSLDYARAVGTTAANMMQKNNDRSLKAIQDSNKAMKSNSDRAMKSLKSTTDKSLGMLAEAKKDNAKEIVKWGLISAVLVAVTWIFRK